MGLNPCYWRRKIAWDEVKEVDRAKCGQSSIGSHRLTVYCFWALKMWLVKTDMHCKYKIHITFWRFGIPQKNVKYLNNSYIGQAQWLTPIIPALWKAEARRIAWAQEFKTSLGNIVRPCLYKKNFLSISWAWWCTPVVPAICIWEAEVGGSLEPRSVRL